MEKVLDTLKKVGAALAAFVIICAFIGGAIGIQAVCWSAKYHPDESWWTLAMASLIILGFAVVPGYRTVKKLVRIAMDK